MAKESIQTTWTGSSAEDDHHSILAGTEHGRRHCLCNEYYWTQGTVSQAEGLAGLPTKWVCMGGRYRMWPSAVVIIEQLSR